jgi:protein-S-isoprenylcysteine O-methyltransferase Ste14
VKPLRIAYGLLACFFVAERLLRRGRAAASLQEGQDDRGTTRAIGRAFGWSMFALCIAPLLNRRRIGPVAGPRLSWGGIAAMAAGLGLRVWAARVLGAFYTRTLRTSGEQRIVEEGPYRLVRHPGYLGVLLLWLGAGLAAANWIVAATIAATMARAYSRRIAAEEAMLAATFGVEYARYAGLTRRLIPFVY